MILMNVNRPLLLVALGLFICFVDVIAKESSLDMSGKFLYFAYGSNLLAKRIHVRNPSAARFAIGKVQVTLPLLTS